MVICVHQPPPAAAAAVQPLLAAAACGERPGPLTSQPQRSGCEANRGRPERHKA